MIKNRIFEPIKRGAANRVLHKINPLDSGKKLGFFHRRHIDLCKTHILKIY